MEKGKSSKKSICWKITFFNIFNRTFNIRLCKDNLGESLFTHFATWQDKGVYAKSARTPSCILTNFQFVIPHHSIHLSPKFQGLKCISFRVAALPSCQLLSSISFERKKILRRGLRYNSSKIALSWNIKLIWLFRQFEIAAIFHSFSGANSFFDPSTSSNAGFSIRTKRCSFYLPYFSAHFDILYLPGKRLVQEIWAIKVYVPRAPTGIQALGVVCTPPPLPPTSFTRSSLYFFCVLSISGL